NLQDLCLEIQGIGTDKNELPVWWSRRRVHEWRAGLARKSTGRDLRDPARIDRSENHTGGREDRPKDVPLPWWPPVPLHRSQRQRARRMDGSVAWVMTKRGLRPLEDEERQAERRRDRRLALTRSRRRTA